MAAILLIFTSFFTQNMITIYYMRFFQIVHENMIKNSEQGVILIEAAVFANSIDILL